MSHLCPRCGAALPASEDVEVVCRACGERVAALGQITNAPAPDRRGDPVTPSRRRYRYDDEEESPRRPVAEGGTSGKAIAALVLGLVSFGCPVLASLPAIILAIMAMGEIKRSDGMRKGQGMAVTGLILGILSIFVMVPVGLLLPAVMKVREASARMRSQNNLKQIGLALHSVESANGRFPSDSIRDAQGRPLLSWRVAILPYVEQENLHRQFRLNEPWDSPHNIQFVQRMPKIYAMPGFEQEEKQGLTRYQAFTGPGTAFDREWEKAAGRPGRPIVAFPDGTPNTLLMAESATAVPWTKPEDMLYDPTGPLPKMGGVFPRGFNVLAADGSVRFVSDKMPEQSLRALITVDGKDNPGRDW